jgi:hypothetical protein
VLRKCVARRYNLEIKEVPLLEPEKAAQLAKAEAGSTILCGVYGRKRG